MERFYLLTDDERLDGPYTPGELRRRGITPEAKLWVEERSAWVSAGELRGFDSYFLGEGFASGVSEDPKDEYAEHVEAPQASSQETAQPVSDEPAVPIRGNRAKKLMLVYCWVIATYMFAFIVGVILMWVTAH